MQVCAERKDTKQGKVNSSPFHTEMLHYCQFPGVFCSHSSGVKTNQCIIHTASQRHRPHEIWRYIMMMTAVCFFQGVSLGVHLLI